MGANENDEAGENAGHVRIYEWVNNQWKQLGADIDGKYAFEFTGSAVDLSHDGYTVAVGAHANGMSFGHVRVYDYNREHEVWTQKGADIVGEAEYDFSGAAIDMSADGNIVAIGAYKNDDAGSNSEHCSTHGSPSGGWPWL